MDVTCGPVCAFEYADGNESSFSQHSSCQWKIWREACCSDIQRSRNNPRRGLYLGCWQAMPTSVRPLLGQKTAVLPPSKCFLGFVPRGHHFTSCSSCCCFFFRGELHYGTQSSYCVIESRWLMAASFEESACHHQVIISRPCWSPSGSFNFSESSGSFILEFL